MSEVVNVVFAGLGGQGVLTVSDMLADAAFQAGYEVKKSELHGMSQRGGSVTSDVRFGTRVSSPMIPDGEADFLVVLEPTQVDNNIGMLKESGTLLVATQIDVASLASPKCLNVALLGRLSSHLEIDPEVWLAALKARLPEKLWQMNVEAFAVGRGAA